MADRLAAHQLWPDFCRSPIINMRAPSIPRLIYHLGSICAGIVALMIYLFYTRQGTLMTPDGWAYWQGALSLYEDGAYRFIDGQPIVYWPPAFSAYIALWFLSIGQYASTMIYAIGLLVILQGLLWTTLASDMIRSIHLPVRFHIILVLSAPIFIGLFVPLNARWPLAHVMLYALLPLYLILFVKHSRASAAIQYGMITAAMSFLGITLVLTHNTALAFVIAAGCVLTYHSNTWRRRIISFVAIFLLPILIWLITRMYLGMGQSHHANSTVMMSSYLSQMAYGYLALLLPESLLANGTVISLYLFVGFMFVTHWKSLCHNTIMPLLIWIILVCAILLVMFTVADVTDQLDGRFILFLPLLTYPIVSALGFYTHRACGVVIVLVLLTAQIHRTHVWLSYYSRTPLTELGYPGRFVPHNSYLSSQYKDGPPVMTSSGLLLSPGFDWSEWANNPIQPTSDTRAGDLGEGKP